MLLQLVIYVNILGEMTVVAMKFANQGSVVSCVVVPALTTINILAFSFYIEAFARMQYSLSQEWGVQNWN